MVSAAEQVYGVPELLEMVFDHLPTKDLLLAQRVSQDFRNGIKASKRLQERLFLRPEKLCGEHIPPDSRRKSEEDIYDAAYAKNRWIIHQKKTYLRRKHQVLLNPFFWRPAQFRGWVGETVSSAPVDSLRFLHPALAELSLRRESPPVDEVELRVALHENLSTSDTVAMTLFAPEPSWRRMLVKQCPCTEIVLCMKIKKEETGERRLKGRRFPADANMGEIMDFCASQYATFKAGGFEGDSDSEASVDEEGEDEVDEEQDD